MRRRDVITLLGGVAAGRPIVSLAQQGPMPVIGFLKSTANNGISATAFRQGLSDSGFVEGRNVGIEYRWAEGRIERLPELAGDLVRRGVTLIATPGDTPAARAAKAATATIPIVFSVAGDPVQLGLVTSLSRPGGNATGFSEMNAEVASKRIGILRELVPNAARFGLIVDADNPLSSSTMGELQKQVSANGWRLSVRNVAARAQDVEMAFASFAQERIDGLLVSPGAAFFQLRPQFVAMAMHHRIPAIYWDRQLAQAGGLISYGSNITDQFRDVGIYAARILKGERAGDLPVQQPTKFEFVINLQTAKALGLTIPPTLLALADEVIE
jgi:putative ABC transport system substrate-binding protein